MHTDLSAHLHSDKCNELIKLLRQCRIDYPARQLLGKCDHEYIEMTKCLKAERIARRQRSIEQSKIEKERMNTLFKEQAQKS
ncbi:COX assembly mitochondrial protein 2 homolog [Dendroctonus ponderosae]|uniref:COX assembly mitochondrial protein n=1 Tax=Dendroctonus ponderosae TaxID=77166 RepID=A0AAR5P2T6_DENPD|nr:COX assembly mitochondrial protein 2 homolog [Dendroctonus ponderosae]KAH1022920.1 hypothetical protein HUJ04_012233 [Dendroctonus ponderosae]KAH1029386.1 hypothetical protein HUJ05_002640 [Dendroctonus ponderosae]